MAGYKEKYDIDCEDFKRDCLEVHNKPKTIEKSAAQCKGEGMDFTLSNDEIAKILLKLYKSPKMVAANASWLSKYFGHTRFKNICKIIRNGVFKTSSIPSIIDERPAKRKRVRTRTQILAKASKNLSVPDTVKYQSVPYVNDTRFDHDD